MAITVVQHKKGDQLSSTTSFTLTGITATSAGNLYVVGAGGVPFSQSVSSVTDNASGGTNTYLQATSAAASDSASSTFADVWYVLAAARGGVTSVTINLAGTTTYQAIWFWEVSGFSSSSFDAANHANNQLASGTDNNGPSITTSGTTDFVVGVVLPNASITTNPKTGNEFTAGGDIQVNGPAGCSLITTNITGHNPVWTNSASNDHFCATTAAFAVPVGGGGGGPTIPQLMTPNNQGSSLIIIPRPIVIGY